MNYREIAKMAYLALDEKKGMNINVIDISKISVIADYFVIASGNNSNQVQAMADNVEEKLRSIGVEAARTEGYNTANWILMDFNGVIVHIFNKEDRFFYDLDRIWQDGKILNAEDL